MAFKDKEEFFDGLWDHLFKDETPDDEDQKWFDEKVIPFFENLIGESAPNNDNSGGSSRRRSSSGSNSGSGNSGVSGPRRKRRATSTGGGSYGANLFFGGN